jgi:hypothetical protein
MQKIGIVVLLNTKVQSVFVDTDREIVEVNLGNIRYTAKKIVATSNSDIRIENPQVQAVQPHRSRPFPHIYLLIEDPTPPRFTYRGLSGSEASRAMNCTGYVDIPPGLQVIAIQVHGEQNLSNPEKYVDDLKKMNLIDQNARLLKAENYIYQQCAFSQALLHKLGPNAQKMFEVIHTGHISMLANQIEKWKKVMKPWNEIIGPLQAAG